MTERGVCTLNDAEKKILGPRRRPGEIAWRGMVETDEDMRKKRDGKKVWREGPVVKMDTGDGIVCIVPSHIRYYNPRPGEGVLFLDADGNPC